MHRGLRPSTERGADGDARGDGVVVLKFGSSLLDGAAGYRVAVGDIRRSVHAGKRALVVVSARRGITDGLLRQARAVTEHAAEHRPGVDDPSLVARLLGTGEEASAALLGLAVTAAGFRARVLGVDELGLITEGPEDDAEPVDVDVAAVRRTMVRHDVTIVPGFAGRDVRGRPTILGRGGSDYTALFLGRAMGAGEIRLVKDVDGVFVRDPKAGGLEVGDVEAHARAGQGARGGNPRARRRVEAEHAKPPVRALASASWELVERLGGGVVQRKALRFAKQERLAFRVAAPGGVGTRVGGS